MDVALPSFRLFFFAQSPLQSEHLLKATLAASCLPAAGNWFFTGWLLIPPSFSLPVFSASFFFSLFLRRGIALHFFFLFEGKVFLYNPPSHAPPFFFFFYCDAQFLVCGCRTLPHVLVLNSFSLPPKVPSAWITAQSVFGDLSVPKSMPVHAPFGT